MTTAKDAQIGNGVEHQMKTYFRYERSCSEEDADNEVTFRERVRDCVMDWRDRIYERPNFDDPHYLVFTPFEPKVHEPARQAMLTPIPTSLSSGPNSHQPHQLDEQYVSSIMLLLF
jgi:hypothetical protein